MRIKLLDILNIEWSKMTKAHKNLHYMNRSIVSLLLLLSAICFMSSSRLTAADIVKVEQGYFHTLLLKSDGSLWGSGHNTYGQLGIGTNSTVTEFVEIFSSGVADVSGGRLHTVVLKTDGSVWGMGYNRYGPIDDSTLDRNIPVEMFSPGTVEKIAAGEQSTYVIKPDGSLWAMGYGWLGDGSFGENAPPTEIYSSGISKVWTNELHTMVLKSDGTLWSFGSNSYGKLGDETTSRRTTPVQVSVENVLDVSCGYDHTLILKTDGSVIGFGSVVGLVTGSGPGVEIFSGDITAISAGKGSSLYLKNDGSLWASGSDSKGQLGDGSGASNQTNPIQIISNGVTQISARYQTSLILKEMNSLWGSGYNNVGQLGDGTTEDKYVFTLLSSTFPLEAVEDDLIAIEDGLAVNINVIANDLPLNHPSIVATDVSDTPNATVSLLENGTLAYLPNPDFFGSEDLTYTITNGEITDTGVVHVVVNATPDPPEPQTDERTIVEEGQLLNFNVLLNDENIDDTTLNLIFVSTPVNGTVDDFKVTGEVTYTPHENFNGVEVLNYDVNNGHGDDVSSTLTITVTPKYDSVVAVDDNYAVAEETQLVKNVLENDENIDSHTLEAMNLSSTLKGEAVLQGNGTFAYTPHEGFTGIDILTYDVFDGTTTDSGQITIEVANKIELLAGTDFRSNDYLSSSSESLKQIGDQTYAFKLLWKDSSEKQVVFSNYINNSGLQFSLTNSVIEFFATNTKHEVNWSPVEGQVYEFVVVYDDFPASLKVYLDAELVIDDASVAIVEPTTDFFVGVRGVDEANRYQNQLLSHLSHFQMYTGTASDPDKWDGTIDSLGGLLTPILTSVDGSIINNDQGIAFEQSGSTTKSTEQLFFYPNIVKINLGEEVRLGFVSDPFLSIDNYEVNQETSLDLTLSNSVMTVIADLNMFKENFIVIDMFSGSAPEQVYSIPLMFEIPPLVSGSEDQVNHFEFNELEFGAEVVNNNFYNSGDDLYYGFSEEADLADIKYAYNEQGGTALRFGELSDLSSVITSLDFLDLDFGRQFTLETKFRKSDLPTGKLTLLKLMDEDTGDELFNWYVDSEGKVHLSLHNETLHVTTLESIVTSNTWVTLQLLVDLNQVDAEQIVTFISEEGSTLAHESSATLAEPLPYVVDPLANVASEMLVRETAYELSVDFLRIVTRLDSYDSQSFYGGESYVIEDASASVMIPGKDVMKRVRLSIQEINGTILANINELRLNEGLYDRHPIEPGVFHGVFEFNFALETTDYEGSMFVDVMVQKPNEPYKKVSEIETVIDKEQEVQWIHHFWNSRSAEFDWTAVDAQPYQTNDKIRIKFVLR